MHVVGCCVVVLVHVVLTSLVPSLTVGVFGADLSTGVGKAEFVGAFTEDATMRAFAQHLCAQAGDSDDWAASDSDSDDGDMAAPASTAAAALVDPNAVLFGGDLAAACWDVMRRCLAKEKPGAAALYLALMASVQRLGTNDHALSAANLALAFRYCAMASSRHPGSLLLGRDFTAATLITLVARGVAGQEVLGAGTLAAAAPFIVGWVGAGYFAGDYDSDSPNAALWGDAPRAITTGALTFAEALGAAVEPRRMLDEHARMADRIFRAKKAAGV